MATYYGIGIKEEIFIDLETQLKKIVGIKHTEWQRTDRRGISQHLYPGVFINDLRVDRTQVVKNIWKNIHTIMLVGFVWATEAQNLGTVLNSWIVQMKQKTLADSSRNSNAYDTDVETIVTDGGSYHPQGQCIMSVIVTYFTRE